MKVILLGGANAESNRPYMAEYTQYLEETHGAEVLTHEFDFWNNTPRIRERQ